MSAKIRTLEADHLKARKKYLSSFQAENEKRDLEEHIQTLEDIQEEDLEEEEETNYSEALKAIRKRKSYIDQRKRMELDKTLDTNLPPEQRQAAKDKLLQLNESYGQLETEEKLFAEKLGKTRSLLDEEQENLQKRKEELEKTNEEDKKIINERAAGPEEKRLAEERVAIRENAASALPGLIGSIVSFLFKAAGQAISYLAEHTWLLILAVVFFVVERYLKR